MKSHLFSPFGRVHNFLKKIHNDFLYMEFKYYDLLLDYKAEKIDYFDSMTKHISPMYRWLYGCSINHENDYHWIEWCLTHTGEEALSQMNKGFYWYEKIDLEQSHCHWKESISFIKRLGCFDSIVEEQFACISETEELSEYYNEFIMLKLMATQDKTGKWSIQNNDH